MNQDETGLSSQTSGMPTRLKRLLIFQFVLVLVAAAAFAYIGWKIKPLIQKQGELENDIAEKTERLSALRQQNAEQEKLSKQLRTAINEGKDPSLVKKAAQIELQALRGYKVGIYYLLGDAETESRAHSLMAALAEAKCPAVVALYGKDAHFFDYINRLSADTIRYEPDYETAQAQALSSLLKSIDSSHQYALAEVANRTPNFISIVFAYAP